MCSAYAYSILIGKCQFEGCRMWWEGEIGYRSVSGKYVVNIGVNETGSTFCRMSINGVEPSDTFYHSCHRVKC